MSKAFRTLGRRMSPSISSTRWPSWASEMARLMETVVFPSLGCELLTSKVRGGRSAVESRTEVRKLRNDSASADCWVASASIRYHRGVVDGRAKVCGFPLASGLLPPYRRYTRSEEHTSELQSQSNLVCRLLLEKKKNRRRHSTTEPSTTHV